jgi:dCMP deaminase
MENSELKWHKRFAEMTKMVSSWSKDPSTQVGAVIVDEDNRIISCGYNGFPKSIPDDEQLLMDRDFKYDVIIHAEENAIMFANTSLKGKTIYVTHHPCPKCASKIAQTGISRVVVTTKPSADFMERWKVSMARSKYILQHAEVDVLILED